MTSNSYISEFSRFPARRLTVVEYRRHGGIWRVTSGVLMRAPKFSYIIGEMMSFSLHSDANGDWNTTSSCFDLQCDSYTTPSFELAGDGSLGILRGFRRDGYEVEIFLHCRAAR